MHTHAQIGEHSAHLALKLTDSHARSTRGMRLQLSLALSRKEGGGEGGKGLFWGVCM